MKYKILLSLLLIITLTGCADNKKVTNTNKETSDEEVAQQQETTEAWQTVEESFNKLNSVSYTGEGLHSEVAHIDISEYDNSQLHGSYEQSKVFINQNGSNTNFKIYSVMDFIDEGKIGRLLIMDEQDATLENLLKDHVNVSESSVQEISVIDDVIQNDNGETNSKYANYLELFKQSNDFPDFLNRGKTNARLLPDSYYQGKIEDRNDGKKITFIFDKNTQGYSKNLESFYKEYGSGTAYDVTDAFIPCQKDDPKAEEFTSIDEQGKEVQVYMKPGLEEKFISAKIEIILDKEGYPVSYKRESIFKYAKQNTKIPYFVSYTFTRI